MVSSTIARTEIIPRPRKRSSSLSWRCFLNGSTGVLLVCLGVHLLVTSTQTTQRKQQHQQHLTTVRTSSKYATTQTATSSTSTVIPISKADMHTSSLQESKQTISFCAEKCKHVKQMCTDNLYRDKLSLPAPSCLSYSTTTQDDIYWPPQNNSEYIQRNIETNALIDEVAKEARIHRQSLNLPSSACEEVKTEYTGPMMFPDEFEFITKLMANVKPATYLEWGCGMSTSFYPLLASEKVIAIDGFPPWCEQVGEEPRVKCMREENKLHFFCPELVGVNGNPVQMMQPVGKLPQSTPDADVENVMDLYVNSVTQAMIQANITKFDVALVDGRFRVQCALKLLPYLHSESVLLMHDFWVRYNIFKDVLGYYYVIGYARSVVALKKKEGIAKEVESNVYKRYMNRESLTWNDIK
jgi:hypothetical protein